MDGASPRATMSDMGHLHIRRTAFGAGLGGVALLVGPAWAWATATSTTTTTTTTTTRPQRPGVYTPTVSPSTIDNRGGCGHSTSATISTGTTGKVDHVTFRVEVGGRTATLSATGTGSRWSATLNGGAFYPDHGSGTVRATATGPSGTAESGDTPFTVADCPA
jgi:hypothetical protein